MKNEVKELTLRQLLNYFLDKRDDKRFCFILGAGASVQSGIPMAGKLAKEWLTQIKDRDGDDIFKDWVKENNIEEDNPAKSYSMIYDKRFYIDPADGFDYLEKAMDGKEPSCGYSVLSQVLAMTNHNVVITTNFDNLIAEALYMYTIKRPLICGHESLTGFIRPIMNRPLIAKIHRDIFLAPKSSTKETCALDDNWIEALSNIFSFYTPIVIGYGGNDGSLMGFLEKLMKIKGGIFWCYRESSGKPEKQIINLVKKHSGFIIPIEGFDEMMIQLNSALEFELIDEKIISVANSRAASYRKQIESIQKREKKPETNTALQEIISKSSKESNWWSVYLKAENEKDPARKEEIFKKGIEDFPASYELYNAFGSYFLNKKEYDKAIEYYNLALDLNPDFSDAYNNWGVALLRLSRNKTGNDAMNLLKESKSKFHIAIKHNKAIPEYYANLASSLLGISLNMEDKVRVDLCNEALIFSMRAESIEEGSGSYNAACAYSLLGEMAESLKWFENALKFKDNTREFIEEDTDLDFIRKDPKFNELLDKYRPKNI